MRYLMASLLALLCLTPAPVHAQGTGPFIKVVIKVGSVPAGAQTTLNVVCPTSWYPVGYSTRPMHEDQVSEVGAATIDHANNPLNLATFTNASVLNGAGYEVTVKNNNPGSAEVFEGTTWCLSPTVFASGATSIVRQAATMGPHQTRNLTGFCPATQYAAGAYNDGAQAGASDQGSAPVWGTEAAPLYLGNAEDGTTGPATGWESTALNATLNAKTLTQVIYCGNLATAQTLIRSATATVGSALFAEFGAVPDMSRLFARGFDAVRLFSQRLDYYFSEDASYADGIVAQQFMYYNPPGSTYESTTTKRGSSWRFELLGGGAKEAAVTPKATARVVFASLVLPSAAVPPAPTTVTVIEFYNKALDHYFITAIPKEINDLDTGVHVGWARTGESFKAYGVGSTGHTGRHPVCRAYGNPKAGLDSHFYSASMEECYSTLSKFNDAWLLEASEVFEMDLPDPITGACPAGDVPVYRAWNGRADSNHRYMTSIALRNQMVVMGYIAEGYGPDAVTLCALAA